MSRVWTAISAVILLLAWTRISSLEPHRERGVLPIDPPTPYFRYLPDGATRGRVLVVHGLNVSKELMQLLCAAFADSGFDVYAIDLPGHGDSTAPFSATRARSVVAEAIEQLEPVDVAVGHSLGGGLLLDVAADRVVSRMILLSPAPTPLGEIDLSHTLVVSGGLDIPAINAFIPELEGAEWWRTTWGAHGTALFNPKQAKDMVRWLGGDVEKVRAGQRLFWTLLTVLSAVGLGICLLRPWRGWAGFGINPGLDKAAVWFVLASLAAAVILRFVPVLDWLHLYATSYLIGFFFLVGSGLCVAARSPSLRSAFGTLSHDSQHPERSARLPAATLKSLMTAVPVAVYFIGVVLVLAVGHITHVTLQDGRWWRFLVIALASFPLFYFDETRLRTASWWRAALTGILTRAILGACIVTGALVLNRDAGFLVLIMHFVVLFWIGLWFLTDVVRRSVQDALAAALFASLVQGWVFAAWVVLT